MKASEIETAIANYSPCARPTCGRTLAQHHRKGLYLVCEESGCEHFQRASNKGSGQIVFRSLRARVTVHSESDSRWIFQSEKTGNSPPDPFSLRGDLVHECSDMLYGLQEALGSPPGDLVCQVTEEWSCAG